MYAQNPARGPGIAISPHPAKYATRRGPKSRAGFQPACVSGANRLMSAATVKPISSGVSGLAASAAFRLSASANITNAKTAVPNPSTAAAPSGEMSAAASAPVP